MLPAPFFVSPTVPGTGACFLTTLGNHHNHTATAMTHMRKNKISSSMMIVLSVVVRIAKAESVN
jgi:hypothetical protein